MKRPQLTTQERDALLALDVIPRRDLSTWLLDVFELPDGRILVTCLDPEMGRDDYAGCVWESEEALLANRRKYLDSSGSIHPAQE